MTETNYDAFIDDPFEFIDDPEMVCAQDLWEFDDQGYDIPELWKGDF